MIGGGGETIPTPGSADLVSLGDEKRTVEVLTRSILGLWEVVNNLTRLRPTRREEFRVTIFGSAQIPAEHWVYGAVRDLAAELARMGCVVITGGGPGLMRAANEGAASTASVPELPKNDLHPPAIGACADSSSASFTCGS